MPTLSLKRKSFSTEELKNISLDEKHSGFEKSTLHFCKAWLTGQREFRINTSGSTGAPKEIILKREAMEQSAQMTIDALQLKSTDTSLICLDTKYIAGQMMLVRSLIHGMNIIAAEPIANPFSIIAQNVDVTALVPYQLERILDESPEKLDRVRCAIIGGAAISRSLQEKAMKSKCSLYATYGMTETISHVALQKINGTDAQEYFEALRGVQIRLDNRGCLCTSAKHLASEVVTNDLVEIIDDRKFKWLGRLDNVINSGGVKIVAEKVEAVIEKVLGSMHLDNRFFLAGIPDDKLGQRLVVVFEGAPLTTTVQSKILEHARQSLAKYETPKEFLFLPRFTETASGKVNRFASLH